MSDTEKKIADTQGQYLQAVSQGQHLTDAEWQNCRLILTTERIAMIADEKRQVALSDIDRIVDRFDVNQQSTGVKPFENSSRPSRTTRRRHGVSHKPSLAS